MTVPDPTLDVTELHVVYRGGVHAVRGVDLRVRSGETVALVGESGCGKTTIAHAVVGLLPRRTSVAGVMRLARHDGSAVDLARADERERRPLRGRELGYVGQNPFRSCDPLRTVGHHVRTAWTAHGERPPQGAAEVRLAALGLDDAARRLRQRPHEWSGGMLQRAAIVGGTALGPRLVVADEPTSALDADLARGSLHDLRRAADAVLLITHDLSLAEEIADTVYVLYGGEVVERGPARAVVGSPRHPYTRALRAALPTGRRVLPIPLAGRPPDPTEPRRGCAFVGRCDLARSSCHDQHPGLVGDVACTEVDR